MTPLQITSQLSTHAWQSSFELSCAQDKRDIMQYLSDLKNQQELMAFTQVQQSADLRQIMILMQKVLSAPVKLHSLGELIHRPIESSKYSNHRSRYGKQPLSHTAFVTFASTQYAPQTW